MGVPFSVTGVDRASKTVTTVVIVAADAGEARRLARERGLVGIIVRPEGKDPALPPSARAPQQSEVPCTPLPRNLRPGERTASPESGGPDVSGAA